MPLYPDYPVLTERLLLRPVTEDDFEAMLAYQSQPETVRFIPYGVRTRAELVEAFEAGRYGSTIDEAPGHAAMAVELRATGELIGDVVLMFHSAEHLTGEVGYVFHPAHHGNGYATEAVRALLGLGFDVLGLHRIAARIDARNTASAAVAERAGLRKEAHFRENEWFKGEWIDELVYAILAGEWSRQSLSEIGDEILDVLDAHAEPDEVGRDLER